MPVDNLLKRSQELIHLLLGVEGHRDRDQVGVSGLCHQMVEQNTVLQRRQRIDIMNIRVTTGHLLGNKIDLGLAQVDQRQVLGSNPLQTGADAVGRYGDVLVLTDILGELGQDWLVVEIAHRDGVAHPLQPRHHLDRKNRITTELEEAVVPADMVQTQEICSDGSNRLLDVTLLLFVVEGVMRVVVAALDGVVIVVVLWSS